MAAASRELILDWRCAYRSIRAQAKMRRWAKSALWDILLAAYIFAISVRCSLVKRPYGKTHGCERTGCQTSSRSRRRLRLKC